MSRSRSSTHEFFAIQKEPVSNCQPVEIEAFVIPLGYSDDNQDGRVEKEVGQTTTWPLSWCNDCKEKTAGTFVSTSSHKTPSGGPRINPRSSFNTVILKQLPVFVH